MRRAGRTGADGFRSDEDRLILVHSGTRPKTQRGCAAMGQLRAADQSHVGTSGSGASQKLTCPTVTGEVPAVTVAVKVTGVLAGTVDTGLPSEVTVMVVVVVVVAIVTALAFDQAARLVMSRIRLAGNDSRPSDLYLVFIYPRSRSCIPLRGEEGLKIDHLRANFFTGKQSLDRTQGNKVVGSTSVDILPRVSAFLSRQT